LGILLRVQQGMAFHALIVTFIVLFKILIIFGVKSVTFDFFKKTTFFDKFFFCNLAKTETVPQIFLKICKKSDTFDFCFEYTICKHKTSLF